MTVLDPPLDPQVLFLGALTTAVSLAVLVFLARHDGEAFVGWAIVSWSLRLGYLVVPLARLLLGGEPRPWLAASVMTSAASSLALLATGLAYRFRRPLSRPGLIGAGLVVGGLGVATMVPAVPVQAVAWWVAATEVGALTGAGIALWPGRARAVRGAHLLTGAVLTWAAVRLALELTLSEALALALIPVATVTLVLQMAGLLIVVLYAARQGVEFLKEFNERLIDGMALGLTLVGPDLRVRHANRRVADRTGADPRGQRCFETYLARSEPCPACPWREGAAASRQFTVEAAGGRTVLLTCSPLATADGPVLLELLNDITEQEAMRARLLHSERLATVGAMASRVAHEIRNPLGIMAVHADLLARELAAGGDAGEAATHLAVVKDEIRSVGDLVASYLRFGRLPALRREPVDLARLLEARVAPLEAECEARSIALVRPGAGSAGAMPGVMADGEQLGQAVTNLVRNAIEAMPEGGTLTVGVRHDDGSVILEVADTGPGVAPEDAERIFEPFHTTKTTGTGLGLALAREIVQEHGGSLRCVSRARGAAFVLTLPADGHGAAAHGPRVADGALSGRPAGGDRRAVEIPGTAPAVSGPPAGGGGRAPDAAPAREEVCVS